MSAIDTSCYTLPPEKESGAGEMNRLKSPCDSSKSAHLIVSEIVSDIVENTFDAVSAKNTLPPKIEKITPNVVGDILENILSPTQTTEVSNKNYQDETALLDDEIKKIINEMKYPPEHKTIICTKGVGDQLGDKSELSPDKLRTDQVKRNTLERKNRLTNLVRNSKQMLVKLVTNDKENEVRLTKSEEIHEKVIKVIDLEGHEHFMEAGSSSATGILKMPPESGLDMVDLERHEGEGEHERKVEDAEMHKGDEKKSASSSKKKWNFGAKIMRYIKRNKESKK